MPAAFFPENRLAMAGGGEPVLHNPALGRDEARLWADPLLGGVEVTACRFVTHSFAPHAHDSLMIGLIEAGGKSFARGRSNHIVAPGEISVVNAGEMHTGSRAAGSELRYRALYVPHGLLDCDCCLTVASATIKDPELFHRLWAATEAFIGQASRLEREELLLAAIGLIARRHGESPPDEPRLQPALARAREILSDNAAWDLSIAEVARAVDLSPYHLMRSFRRQFGMTMHAYRLSLRIERAKRRLRGSADPLAKIALDCGFGDQSHFTRRFKKTAGYTPLVYRNAYHPR